MSRIRFIFLIFNFMYIIFIFPLTLLDYFSLDLSFTIGLVLIIAFYVLKRIDRNKFIKVTKVYLDECDPEKYIYEFKKLMKHIILPSKAKYLNDITIAMAYYSLGKIEEARKSLEKLVDVEPKFPPVIRFWYYKAWLYYFLETKEIEKIKTLLEQSRLIIDNVPTKFKSQLSSNYNNLTARYYVLANIHLNLAEQEFSKIYKMNLPKLHVVSNVYYLGVIAYKQNDFRRALECFKSVEKNGNKLIFVQKALFYINKINEETSEI